MIFTEAPAEVETGAIATASRRLASLQRRDGAWEAEVIWSPVITAQAVIVQTIVGRVATAERRRLILHYFRCNRRPDGGWGLHPESAGYVFVTTLVYVAARLLGASADEPMLADARRFLSRAPVGIYANPQWGRFWLALIGLYDRGALNACPPELFLLPRRSSLSPLNFYCHTRYIYLAMAYLSGSDFRADLGDIADELRNELPGTLPAGVPPHAVEVAASDLHELPGPVLTTAYELMRWAGPLWRALPGASALRRRALRHCLDGIRYEQRATSHQGLSPVSGLLNTLALFADDSRDPEVAASLAGVESWCWTDEQDGIRYAGARSTAWDTSFALQALVAVPEGTEAHATTIRRGYRSLVAMQATSDPPDRSAQARDINSGGWCFTEGVQAWPVSDCTAEAVIALCECDDQAGLIDPAEKIVPTRLAEAANFILSRQNEDGGFGSYERRRGRPFLERLNPSEMFGRCMTELTYVECTASSIRALNRIVKSGASVDETRLRDAIRRGVAVILSRQLDDGSWPGFWGINFVYGTLFALTALHDVGLPADHAAFSLARIWLESRQKADGGWGEHFDGCATGTYAENAHSLVITTAWATLALLHTSRTTPSSARRGGEWLLTRQDANGDWPRDSVNGVFFGTAMLDYRLYNTYFPLMALAKLEHRPYG